MSTLRIEVDADDVIGRRFTALERQQLPFAIVQAVNKVAWEVRGGWQQQARRVFDRPTPLTVNAMLYRKATRQRLWADVFIRDEAAKGTSPAKYLQAEVDGGERRKKGFEVLLQQKGMMPAGDFAISGRGAKLDAYGNVKAGEINKILAQTGSFFDQLQNESAAGRDRRLKRQRKRGGGGSYFVVTKRRGKLLPGVYERIETSFGSALRSVLIYTPRARYRPRYDIIGYAQRTWNRLMPFHFERELAKAIETAMYRGGSR